MKTLFVFTSLAKTKLGNLVTIFLLCIPVCFAETVFHFQPNNKPSNESRVVAFLKPLPDGTSNVTSFSISLWFKIHYFRRSSFPFSYSVSNLKSDELKFKISPNKIEIVFNDDYIKQLKIKPLEINPMEWYHLGIVYDYTQGNETFTLYMNGEEKVLGKVKFPRVLQLNGSLVLGQETDILNGGFRSRQSFCGKLFGMNIYSRELSAEEIKSLYECSEDRNLRGGDILNWSSASWTFHGAVEIVEEPVCQRKRKPFMIFAQKHYLHEARDLCRRLLRSDLYLPPSFEYNSQLYNESIPYMKMCRPYNHGYSFFWLGATDQLENGLWRNFENQIVNYTNFKESGETSSQKCAAFYTFPHFGSWNDVKCTIYQFCFACNVPEDYTSYLRLRGLCDEDNDVSAQFKLGEILSDGWRVLDGFTKYKMVFDKSKTSWQLLNAWNNEEIVSYFDLHETYPVGVRNWTISKDFSACDLFKGNMITLSLSTCTNNEFTCNNGDCIDISRRCDLVADCSDNSDEDDCRKFIAPKNYKNYLLPSGPDGDPLEINVTLYIEKMSEIDVLEMKLRIDFLLQMTWYDPRLTFSNLKPEEDINIINVLDVWTPEYQYINADYPSLHEINPYLTIRRMTNPLEDHGSRALRDELFEGESNPLEYNVRGNAAFYCLMNLIYYPFDFQRCNIDLKFKSARTFVGKWGHIDVIYTGPKKILEYEIGRTETTNTESLNFSLAAFSISLSRRYSYYIITIYAPTFMLLLISYASLYCSIDDPDLRIMMTITTLLVLYSVYQQISEALPKTSYIKAVDIWCFFSLSVIFSLILFHVFVGANLKFLKKIGIKRKDSFKIRKTAFDFKEPKKLKIFRWSRIVYFIIIVGFTSGYILFGYFHSIEFFHSI